jgi:NADH-quinone oxidoreductase subunit E
MYSGMEEIEKKADTILAKNGNDKSLLVSILQDVQGEYGYLPREMLALIGNRLCIPMSQVYSVATFFKSFSLKPRGRHTVHVCVGTACHVRGADRVLETLERELKINPGETTADQKFTMETVNCVGACALGPIIIIDGQYAGQVKVDEVKSLLESHE